MSSTGDKVGNCNDVRPSCGRRAEWLPRVNAKTSCAPQFAIGITGQPVITGRFDLDFTRCAYLGDQRSPLDVAAFGSAERAAYTRTARAVSQQTYNWVRVADDVLAIYHAAR